MMKNLSIASLINLKSITQKHKKKHGGLCVISSASGLVLAAMTCVTYRS